MTESTAGHTDTVTTAIAYIPSLTRADLSCRQSSTGGCVFEIADRGVLRSVVVTRGKQATLTGVSAEATVRAGAGGTTASLAGEWRPINPT